MPLYEYECKACSWRFEQIQKFSDPPLEVCPNCGERQLQKLLSSPAIQFKGSGWYITDYARKGTADHAKTDGSAKGDEKGATEKGAPSEKSADKSPGDKAAASTPSTTTPSSSSAETAPATPSSKKS
jgi:putative FmdB family regulatory protein